VGEKSRTNGLIASNVVRRFALIVFVSVMTEKTIAPNVMEINMGITKIPWAEVSWNPISGCSPIASGCQNCYAKKMAYRLRGRYGYPQDEPFRPTFDPDKLEQPLKWKKPRLIFLGSMSDFGHIDFTNDQLAKIINVTIKSPQHTFLILTKRPQRLLEFFNWLPDESFNNLWFGTSASTQKEFDENAEILCKIDSPNLFVSLEPLLEDINLGKYELAWYIAGAESGKNKRTYPRGAISSLIKQCSNIRKPLFIKQVHYTSYDGTSESGILKLDKDIRNWPPEYQIRQWPEFKL